MKRVFSLLLLMVLFVSSYKAGEEVNFDDVNLFFADKSLLKLSVFMDKLGIKNTKFGNITFSSDGEKSWYYQNYCQNHYSEDKSLLVFEMAEVPMRWTKVFAIFEKKDTKYILKDYIVGNGKYKLSEISFYPSKTNVPVFSITGNWGGTGTQTSVITFYQYKNGKANKVLDFTSDKENNTSRISDKYTEKISYSDAEIRVVYDIEISSLIGFYESTFKDRPFRIQVFKTTRQNVYKWNPAEQKYIYDTDSSQLPDKTGSGLSPDAVFYKYFKTEIREVLKNGDKYQREWVEKMFKDIPNQDR